MKIFARYVFRQAAGALLLILLSLGGVVWIALALKQLNVVTSQGQDAWLLVKMTTLALPNLLAIIAPFALLIAVIHTLNRLNGDSELIVLTASGANVWTIARPLIVLALLVSFAVAYVNHVGMPWSLRQLREYIVQVRTDLLTQVIQPGRFSTPEQGLTFHIRERTLDGELMGLVMADKRNSDQQQTFIAERGLIIKQEQSAYLLMTTGHILRREPGDRPAQIISFEKYAVDLDSLDKRDNATYDLKPRERYFDELVNSDPNNAYEKAIEGHLRAELHERLSNPLYPLAFVLIALASVGQAQSTRQNRMERMVIGFVSATGARVAGLAVNNLVVLNAVYVPVMYAIPLLAILLATIAIFINARPRPGPSLGERIGDLFAPLWARLPSLPRLRKPDPVAHAEQRSGRA